MGSKTSLGRIFFRLAVRLRTSGASKNRDWWEFPPKHLKENAHVVSASQLLSTFSPQVEPPVFHQLSSL